MRKFQRIWLIQQPSISRSGHVIDIAPAFDHVKAGGELITLVGSQVYAHSDVKAVRMAIYRRLAAVESLDDDAFFWAGGDPLILGFAFVAMCDFGLSEIWWLKHDRLLDPETKRRTNETAYRPIRIDIGEIELSEASAPGSMGALGSRLQDTGT